MLEDKEEIAAWVINSSKTETRVNMSTVKEFSSHPKKTLRPHHKQQPVRGV
jgi:hypothetical protein